MNKIEEVHYCHFFYRHKHIKIIFRGKPQKGSKKSENTSKISSFLHKDGSSRRRPSTKDALRAGG